jgi:hypothetical protein
MGSWWRRLLLIAGRAPYGEGGSLAERPSSLSKCPAGGVEDPVHHDLQTGKPDYYCFRGAIRLPREHAITRPRDEQLIQVFTFGGKLSAAAWKRALLPVADRVPPR